MLTHNSFTFNWQFLYVQQLLDFIQNENNRKATHSFAPKPLIFKLQQEV